MATQADGPQVTFETAALTATVSEPAADAAATGPRIESAFIEPDELQFEDLLDTFIDKRGRLRPAPVVDAASGSALLSGVRGAELAHALDDLRASAWADATLLSYGGHVRAWQRWCTAQHVPSLPFSPELVAAFLLDSAFSKEDDRFTRDADGRPVPIVSASTMTNRLAALNRAAEFIGVARPGENRQISELMRGIRRVIGTAPTSAKHALDLAAVERCLSATTGAAYVSARTHAMVLLRARTGATAGQLAHLEWTAIALNGDSVELNLAPTHRHGRSRTVRVRAHRNPRLCLVHALHSLRGLAGPVGSVFAHPGGKPLTRQALHMSIQSVTDFEALPTLRDRDLALIVGTAADTVPLVAARDRALLLTGFWTALRRSNLSALSWGDLKDCGADGWSVRIRRSKTDQEGVGADKWVPQAGPGFSHSCPATALRAWRAQLSTALGREPRLDEPVFVSVTATGALKLVGGRPSRMGGDAINEAVQRLTVAAGLATVERGQRNDFGAHSLRAGFVTESLRDDKLTIPEVQEVTGHKSVDVLLAYRREVNAPKRNASRKLLGSLSSP